MGAEGAVYVDVEGSVVDYGINTLSISGDNKPEEGVISDHYWLHWSYDEEGKGGFTGQGWFWSNVNNHLDDAWERWRISNGYSENEYAGESGFMLYLKSYQPRDISGIFEYWTESKALFTQMLIDNYKYWPTGGCVELT